MASQSPAPRKRPAAFARPLAMAMELPFILISAVLVGGGGGYLLDHWLHTSPIFTLVLGLIGFAGGVWEILKLLSHEEKEEEKDDGGR